MEILCETPPSNELELVLREQLETDGVRLTAHPYSTPVSVFDIFSRFNLSFSKKNVCRKSGGRA